MIVHVWIEDVDGKFLIAKRARRKTFGGLWECPGGGAVAGEQSIDAAVREIREEVGIALDPAKGKCIKTCVYEAIRGICDVWHFTHELKPGEIMLHHDEVTDFMLAAPDEILRLAASGEFVPVYGYLDWLFGPAPD